MISIIIPVYNAEQYILRCYESVASQNYSSYEIIFVNDGSSDQTASILRQLEQEDEKVKVVNHIVNKGIAVGRRTGIQNARGEYITFLDVDDTLPAGTLQAYIDAFSIEEEIDVVVGGYCIVRNEKVSSPFPPPFFGTAAATGYVKHIFTKGRWELWGKAYRHSLFVDPLLFVDDLMAGEDLVLNTQLLLRAAKIRFIDTPCYYYYKGHLSLTVTVSGKYATDVIRSVMTVEQILEQNPAMNFQKELDSLYLLAYSTSIRRGDIPKTSLYGKEIKKHLSFNSLKTIGGVKALYVLLCYISGSSLHNFFRMLINKFH